MTQPHQKVKTKGLPTPITLSVSLGYALCVGGGDNQSLRQEKGYMCVSVCGGVELVLGSLKVSKKAHILLWAWFQVLPCLARGVDKEGHQAVSDPCTSV